MIKKYRYILFFLGLLLLNYIVSSNDMLWDLTQDGKYTINELSSDKIDDVNENVVVTVFFEGDLPPEFRSYRDYIDYYLREVRRANSNIDIIYKNPIEGTAEEKAEVAKYLRSYGVVPISRKVQTGESSSRSLIYPYISVHSQRRVVFVDLLEAKAPNQSESEALLSSQINFEAKLTRAIRDVTSDKYGLVGVVGDDHILLANGLINEQGKLGSYYFFPMDADQLLGQVDTLDAVIAVMRDEGLERREMVAIDQCQMHGVPVLWLVDKYDVSVDSINRYGLYTAIPRSYDAEDMLFKHGTRVSSDLMSSMDCGGIPQVVGREGGQAKTELVSYPYHLLAQQDGDWLVQNSSAISMPFATSIDTLRLREGLSRQVIAQSSTYSRLAKPPVSLSFEELRSEMQRSDYQAGKQNMAVATEGSMKSYFTNRLTDADVSWMSAIGIQPKAQSEFSREVVVADADAFLPTVNNNDGSLFPIGYSYWERRSYRGNQQFAKSILEYLVHGDELVALSRRELVTPLLDEGKWQANKTKYYPFIFLLPLLGSILLMMGFRYYRKMKYSRG